MSLNDINMSDGKFPIQKNVSYSERRAPIASSSQIDKHLTRKSNVVRKFEKLEGDDAESNTKTMRYEAPRKSDDILAVDSKPNDCKNAND